MECKRKVLSILLVGVIGLLCFGIALHPQTVQGEKSEEGMELEFNEYISQNLHTDAEERYSLYAEDGFTEEMIQDIPEDEIFEIGNTIIILKKEVEQYKEFYSIKGDLNAEEEAVRYAEQRNALYAEALKNGFSVTEEEVDTYLLQLKEDIINDMSDEEYQELIKLYGSEEDYWKFEHQVYEIDLPIQNYVHEMEMEFSEENNGLDGEELSNAWDARFEELKAELVLEQKFTR